MITAQNVEWASQKYFSHCKLRWFIFFEQLWLALGKTMAEKAAWRKSQEMNMKLVTVCHGLLTSPTFPSADDSSAIPYLKGKRLA